MKAVSATTTYVTFFYVLNECWTFILVSGPGYWLELSQKTLFSQTSQTSARSFLTRLELSQRIFYLAKNQSLVIKIWLIEMLKSPSSRTVQKGEWAEWPRKPLGRSQGLTKHQSVEKQFPLVTAEWLHLQTLLWCSRTGGSFWPHLFYALVIRTMEDIPQSSLLLRF